jgi:hypothetical protein
MIHGLWTWMTLIIAPEAVVGRLLGSVSPGTQVDSCGQYYRCERTSQITVSCTDGVE